MEDSKTCTRCGATEGKALGHDWQEATYTKPRTCNRCGVTDGEPIPVQYLNATGKDIYDAVTKGESVKDPLTGDLSGWYMRAATVNGIDFEVDSKGYSGRVLLITVMDSMNVGKTEIYYKTLRAVFDGDDLDTITSWVKKNIGKEAETKIGDANVVLRLTVSKYPIMYIVDDAYLKEVL